MNIYHEDIMIALSILKRISQEKEFMTHTNIMKADEDNLFLLSDRLKKYMSECSLTGLNEINLMISLINQILEFKSKDNSDLAEAYNALSDLLFGTAEKIINVLNHEIHTNKEIIEFNVLTTEELTFIDLTKEKIDPWLKFADFNSEPEKSPLCDTSFKKQLSFETDSFYPLFENALSVFTEQKDKDSFYIMLNHFDQFKGNIDLILASQDFVLEDNHPLMQTFRLCEKVELLFEKNKMKENFDQSFIVMIQSGFDLLHQLMKMIEKEDSSVRIVDDFITQISDFLKITPETIAIDKKNESVTEIKEEDRKTDVSAVSKDKSELIKAQDEGYIRIRQDYLESITNMITELIVSNSSISYIQNKLRSGDSILSVLQALQNTEKSFQRVISDLDELIMTLRLQKMKELFQRFPRLVRDLAKNQGKKINFEMSGEDLELDNIIMKQLADPLMHIIRNSCDHGIETPEIRLSRGKTETGTIRLSAEINGSRMQIEIYDDGGGLSVEKIKKKVLEKGLMSVADFQSLTDQQIFNLIFLPGFSTADKVTEISGRGVGMDVVLQNISRVKGDIRIDSVENKYTQISISLPMTVTISKGLLVGLASVDQSHTTCEEQYLIPLEHVVSIIHIKPEELHCYQEGYFIKYHDQLIGLRHLRDVLQDGETTDLKQKDSLLNVIMEIDSTRRALMIDKVIGIQEISIRMLPDNLKHLDIYRGCATMSDGKAVLVLNPKKLFKE
ncbi:MAG TPA: chemotaxis protein CheA [Candidatus Cloacimonadota bacterium]|nr:chemotaxis protein CheA [Candidatus Cloacimonadota bacterium]